MYRNLFFSIMFFLVNGVVHSQEVVFLPSDWQNPAVFEKGQTAPHAFHVPFSSREAALKNNKGSSENFMLLNGKWKFKWVENPEQLPAGF